MKLTEMTYGIVGMGIMGGSLAKSIRANVLSRAEATGKIYACNRSSACLDAALHEGVADKVFPSARVNEMLGECDLVFICLYPHATIDFIKENRANFKSNSIITDISGVKGIFASSLKELLRDDVDFVIGHPMAGGEKEGYANSSEKFFIGRNYILVPHEFNKEKNLELMRSLITAMGFSRITETTCETHDYKIGFTSQLCHLIAAALVESAEDESITAFGGGSFEDLTRIAMINAPLWTELFLSNREKLLEHISNFEKQTARLKEFIRNNDGETLKNVLEDVREKRLKMGVLRQSK